MNASPPEPGHRARVTATALLACASLYWLNACSGPSATSSTRPASPTAESKPPAAAETKAPSPALPTTGELLKAAAAQPGLPWEGEDWQPLSDGKSLTGWRATEFAGRGEITCESGLFFLQMGEPFTGLNYTNTFPTMNYEIALDAMRVSGADFFCGLTVPVGDSFCSLILGGWGGYLVGISSLDDLDASENETMGSFDFENGRWYRIRMRVTPKKLQAWIDSTRVVDVVITDRKVSVRAGEIEMSKPMGIASWQTSAAVRNIKVRQVDGPEPGHKKAD